MSYQTLEKLFHKDRSAERAANIEAEYQARLNTPGTFRIGYATSAGELFVCMPVELTLLLNEVLTEKRDCEKLLAAFPNIAQDSVAVAKGLGIDPGTLSTWVRPVGEPGPMAEELRKAKREVARLREENEILLKASASFASKQL